MAVNIDFLDLEGGMTLKAFPLYSLLNELKIKIILFSLLV